MTPEARRLIKQLKKCREDQARLPAEQRELCLALKELGVTQYAVAKELGLERQIVNTWYRSYRDNPKPAE